MSDETETASNAKNNERPKQKRGGLIIIAIFIIGMIFFSQHEPVITIDCNADIISSKPDIIMLGAWWCSYCNQAKKYFQKNNIHYCEYDMESTLEGRRLYEKYGGGAVPILLIGEYQLRGFDAQQIEATLDTLKGTQ